MRFFISNNPSNLDHLCPEVTVEAEYGDTCVEGKYLTLAHHGSRSGNPPPCVDPRAIMVNPNFSVGLSHLDLDTLGGIMGIMGQKEGNKAFWACVGQVDIKGVHKLTEILMDLPEVYKEDPGEPALVRCTLRNQLNAYWAWAEENKTFPPRDGSVLDVTKEVQEALWVLGCILNPSSAEHKELIEAGKEWVAKKEKLEASSFRGVVGDVLVREAGQFANHLYEHKRVAYKAIVAFNIDHKSVTISLADKIPGVSCKEIVQDLWGDKAGGHDGIAGSPRGQEMEMKDAMKAVFILSSYLTY